MHLRTLLAVLVLAVSALGARPSAAAAQAAPPAVANPCADSLYLVLRGKALDKLSEREYEYFMQRERACVESQQLRALVDQPRDAAPAPRRDLSYATEAYTQVNTMGGADVYIRNLSDRPIVVNSLEVYDCQGLRSTSCGLHHPKTRILPRQSRRVYTIRFSSPDGRTGYRYRYHVSEETSDEG